MLRQQRQVSVDAKVSSVFDVVPSAAEEEMERSFRGPGNKK